MGREWGIPIWIFLHSLAAQIDPAVYAQEKANLFSHIKNVFALLPCPDCAKHASTAISLVTLNSIQTRDDFKQMLWSFHNSVNARTRKPIYPYASLAIYEKCNLRILYGFFLRELKKPSNNSKLMMDSMARRNMLAKFETWLQANRII
jgi:hypothetical protein